MPGTCEHDSLVPGPQGDMGAGEGQSQKWLGCHLDARLTGLGKLKGDLVGG